MSEPFLGEIKLMSFNFAPKGWTMCNGQLLPINQNQALFSLLGTTYGGNGQTTFALPDLRGRVAMHVGNGHTQGERAGQESHTVTVSEMPQHIHSMNASANPADVNNGAGATLAVQANVYTAAASLTALASTGVNPAITNVGGSQPHNNIAPSLGLNFCIALQGIFPSQN